jgi:hypothetical protein
MVYSIIFFVCLSSPSLEFSEALKGWRWWYPLCIVLSTVSSAWARVFLGAHYPSDCLFSLPQAILILTLVGLLYYLEKWLCGSCSPNVSPGNSCYTDVSDFDPYGAPFPWTNVVIATVFSLVGGVLVLLAARPPLKFWDKIHYVYGLILPTIAFRLTFLCPRLRLHVTPKSEGDDFAISRPPSISEGDVGWAFGLVAVLAIVVLGMRKFGKGRKAKFAAFCALYIVTYVGLLLKRTTTLIPRG